MNGRLSDVLVLEVGSWKLEVGSWGSFNLICRLGVCFMYWPYCERIWRLCGVV